MINGLSVSALSEAKHEMQEHPEESRVTYNVEVEWQTGTRGTARTQTMKVGPHRVSRDFEWTIDEPRQLLGWNHGPSPQEMLLSGVGGCLMVAYSVGASVMGIQLNELHIDLSAELDVRGFLKADDASPVALKFIRYNVKISGDGTPEQFTFLHQQVMERSPNRATVAQGVPVEGTLEILEE